MAKITFGRPPGVAALRAIRTPLFDTQYVMPGMLSSSMSGGVGTEMAFFAVPIGGMTNGQFVKTQSFTCMTQSGRLGVPQEYDFEGINASINAHADDTELVRAFQAATIKWGFGRGTWLNLPLMGRGIVHPNNTIKGATAEQQAVADAVTDRLTGEDRGLPREVEYMQDKNVFDVRVKGKPIRISSAENFHCEIVFNPDSVEVLHRATVHVAMYGTLYSAL